MSGPGTLSSSPSCPTLTVWADLLVCLPRAWTICSKNGDNHIESHTAARSQLPASLSMGWFCLYEYYHVLCTMALQTRHAELTYAEYLSSFVKGKFCERVHSWFRGNRMERWRMLWVNLIRSLRPYLIWHSSIRKRWRLMKILPTSNTWLIILTLYSSPSKRSPSTNLRVTLLRCVAQRDSTPQASGLMNSSSISAQLQLHVSTLNRIILDACIQRPPSRFSRPFGASYTVAVVCSCQEELTSIQPTHASFLDWNSTFQTWTFRSTLHK